MSNPHKGEVPVRLGDGTEYILAFTLGAVAAIEGHFGGKSINAIMDDLSGEKPLISTILVVLWAGLLKHHKLSLDETGDAILLDDLGTWTDAIGRAFSLATPEVKKGARPRKAAAN